MCRSLLSSEEANVGVRFAGGLDAAVEVVTLGDPDELQRLPSTLDKDLQRFPRAGKQSHRAKRLCLEEN